jgi:Flp pilus assembly protein TadB
MPHGEIRTHNLSRRAAADRHSRPRGHWHRLDNLSIKTWGQDGISTSTFPHISLPLAIRLFIIIIIIIVVVVAVKY